LPAAEFRYDMLDSRRKLWCWLYAGDEGRSFVSEARLCWHQLGRVCW